MRAIITVIGKDKVGIVARIATELAKLNLNIIDIKKDGNEYMHYLLSKGYVCD